MKDRVVLVTGATGGLGRVVATSFHDRGAKLVLVSRRLDALRETFASLERIPPLLVEADLTKAEAAKSMANRALEKWGRIDVLANIAGGFSAGPAFHEMEVEAFDRMIDINARTAFLACRAVLPAMLENGSGKIVNVAGRAGLEGVAKMGPYAASKAAVIRLTESLAAEYRSRGINVNCVLPGTMDTEANRRAMPKARVDRWVDPVDVARTILFLSSELSRAIHGAAIPVVGLS